MKVTRVLLALLTLAAAGGCGAEAGITVPAMGGVLDRMPADSAGSPEPPLSSSPGPEESGDDGGNTAGGGGYIGSGG